MLQLTLDPRVSVAALAMLPDALHSNYQPTQPGDLDPAELAIHTAETALKQRATHSEALTMTLRRLQAAGVPSINGRAIADVIKDSRKPPIVSLSNDDPMPRTLRLKEM